MDKFREIIDKQQKLTQALTLLEWDLETCMPQKGSDRLSEIVGFLTMQLYDLMTGEEFLNAIDERKTQKLNDKDRKEVEILLEDIEQTKNIPPQEYDDYSQLVIRSQSLWQKAKSENNYEMYKDTLGKIFDYNIKFAEYNRKDEKCLYDVVLNRYEKGMTVEKLDTFFATLKSEIVPLLHQIMKKPQIKNNLNITTPIENQKVINEYISNYLGFDMSRGVIRESEHPFTTNVDKNDVRITTKYIEDEPLSAILSTIHETGHAIYEQQIDDEFMGTVLAGGGTMGLHESQSRFYENMIGRSKTFWKPLYEKLNKYIDVNMDLDEFYREINIVKPSLIRVDADELTYPLHILVRYEIEKGIFDGTINANNLPQVWNEKMKEYLGVVPTNYSNGVLQDIHWAGGLIGYFPSYALGSVYAAQIYNAMNKEIDISQVLLNGEMDKIRVWLGSHIHKYGKSLDTDEIIKKATGETLNPKYYIDYLKSKYSEIYK